MERIWGFVLDYQWWLYGFLALVVLFYLRRAIVARREAARSIFKLEQEQARGRYGRSVMVMVVLLAIMAAVFGLTNYLLPSLDRPPEPTPTATAGLLPAPTLTSTPAPPTITPTATATKVLPTRPAPVTATPEVVATPVPAVRPPACPNPEARLTSPGVNQVVRGSVPVRGTANTAGFWKYKVEIGVGAEPSSWQVIGQEHSEPVAGGVLETFNSNAYPPGVYTLQLTVADQTGNYPEPCRVTITVQR